MYYKENNNSGLQIFYSMHSDKSLIDTLNSDQLRVSEEYIKFITRHRVGALRVPGGYTFNGSEYNLKDGTVKYRLGTQSEDLVVDGDKLKELLNAFGEIIKCYTEEAFKEIKYSCYINMEGLYDDYVADAYPMLRNVFKVMGINTELDAQCQKFIDCRLILPKYLRTYFENNLKERYRSVIYETAICKSLGKKVLLDKERDVYYGDKCLFISEMREKIMTEDDELNRLMLAARLVSFTELYNGLTDYGKCQRMEAMAEASMKEVYYVHAKNGDRLATKNEKKQLVDGIYKQEVFYLPKEKREKLLYFTWAVTGKTHWINKFTSWGNDVQVSSEIAWLEIEKSIQYLRSAEFLKVDVLELKKGFKEIKYLDSAEDEIIDKSNADKIKIVYNKFRDRTDSYGKMVADIARKATRYGQVLSAKQMNVILKAYEQVSVESEDSYNKYSDSLLVKMQEMLNFFSYKKTDFQYTFMQSIIKKKSCSLKQKNLIDQWYKEYEDIKNERKENETEVFELDGDDFIIEDDDPIIATDGIDEEEIEEDFSEEDNRSVDDKISGIKGIKSQLIMPNMSDLKW